MTTGDVTLEVLRPGKIAVIESASETAHYPMLNRGVFLGLDLPWLDVDYIDESDLDTLLSAPVEHQYAALVLTPGAIALPGVRAILEQRSAELAQALSSGVGMVITATTLGGVERFDLTFLPEGSQVSLVDTGMREMAGTLTTDGIPDDVLTSQDGQQACSALTLAAGHAFGWTHSATLNRPDGQEEPVVWRAQFGLGRVIVSVLPFEWIRRHDMVALALTRATRNRGVLIIGRKDAPPWYADVTPGQVLARVPSSAQLGDLLTSFSHLRLCADTDWASIRGLDRSELLARLENNGTVEFPATGPSGAIYARLDGVPRYLTRLREAQDQLIGRVADLPSSPTFHLLALALLSRASEQVVQGRLYIPDLLRRDAVSAVILSAMSRRVREGNIDGLLLPTANLLAACNICDIDDSAAVTMAAWISMHAQEGTEDQRAQARWALWAASRQDLLGMIPEPMIEPDSLLGRLACQLDAGQLDPVTTDPADPDGDAHDELTRRSDLDRAILAYTHARWGDPTNPQPIWDALTVTRQRRSGHATVPVNVEELCYRTAAQVLLDAHTPLTIHPRGTPTLTGPAPQVATELLTRQAAAEVTAHREREAQQALALITHATRAMAGLLGTLAVVSGLAVSTLPVWLPEAGSLDLQVRLSLAAGLFLILSTVLSVTMATDTAQLVAPSWLRAIGKGIRHLRN
jgi:hypothetical protein